MNIRDMTKKYWEENNCAISTSCALLDFYSDIDARETMFRGLLAFGGGIGEGSICGSVTGTLSAMGILLKGTNDEKRDAFTEFKNRFKQEFGTLMCTELIAKNDGEEDGHRKICNQVVLRAPEIALDIVQNR